MLRAGVKSCFDNGTMYCQRIQVRQGRLYLTDYRAIFFDRHYAPARIMPMLEVMLVRVRVRVRVRARVRVRVSSLLPLLLVRVRARARVRVRVRVS